MNSTSPPIRESSDAAPAIYSGRKLQLTAFAWFFCILGGYYIIRPIRETMGVASGSESLNRLFLATFIAMVLAVPIYSACVARLRRPILIAVVYRFFALNLLLFWWLLQTDSPEWRVWYARAFFVWASVFALYATSVFWSVLTDLFGSSEAKKSFGFIASGGTAGAIAGSLLAGLLAKQLATHTLLLIPAALLEIGLWFASSLQRQAAAVFVSPVTNDSAPQTERDGDPTGGGVIDGIVSVVRSPYLRSICIVLFLGQLCATQLYVQQASIVAAAIPDDASRTKLFANMNLGVQLLTLVLQTTIAGLLMRPQGLTIALAATPIAYALAFTLLGVSPSLTVFVVADVIRRGLAYGVAVPAREVLFTVVSREDKYKSKGFIDTVILRGGDAISSQLLTTAKHLFASAAFIQMAMIPVAILWVAVSVRLAIWQKSLSKEGRASARGGYAPPPSPR